MMRLLLTALSKPPHFSTTPILSLSHLIQTRQSHSKSLRSAFQDNPQTLFQYGCDPLRLRLELHIFYKYSYWQTSPLACAQLRLFHSHLEASKPHPPSTPHPLTLDYMREISLQLLPPSLGDSWLGDLYLQQLWGLLTHTPPNHLPKDALYFIMTNLQRLVLNKQEQLFIASQNDAWNLTRVTELFLQHYVQRVEEMPLACKSTAIMLAKVLRVGSLPFLEYLKRDLQKPSRDLTIHYFLSAMIYLGMNRSFPHEYFYRQKAPLMALLEAADDLSDKKVFNCIAMLEILSRERLPHCEKILARLQHAIEANLPATDVTQLTRILHYYSRLRSTHSNSFLSLVVQRLYLFMDQLDEKHYALIVRAVATLNYCDGQLVERLKGYDYGLFLASLKFGCERLGPYYGEIVAQVEREFRERGGSGREVSYEGGEVMEGSQGEGSQGDGSKEQIGETAVAQ